MTKRYKLDPVLVQAEEYGLGDPGSGCDGGRQSREKAVGISSGSGTRMSGSGP